MELESEILSDLRQLLSEHGVMARWQELDLLVLVSRVKREQQIDMGGFVDSPELSLRVPKLAFPNTLPKFGERIEVDGTEYRISQVSSHPRSPLLTLSLSTTDE
ncbi:MAG: hypothetical protein NTV46_01385 [Verrucomicrobia bacterium]|nr:hypothetical protein [Verrucomicrobiota bacterium]